MALRLRRSQFMTEYLKGQLLEEKELATLLGSFGRNNTAKKRAAKKK
jgi:hypothetical protein